MEGLWDSLSSLNKAFVLGAVVFSFLFLWQIIIAFLGLDLDSDTQLDHGDLPAADHDIHQADHDVASGAAFTVISLRSILAFGTLFTWAGSLYLARGTSVPLALFYSFLWGFGAMIAVSYLFYQLLKMQEVADSSVASALGEEATVYITIPAGGLGKVRVLVRGVMSFVNARARDGEDIPAGTKVRVISVVTPNTLEVEPIRISKEQ